MVNEYLLLSALKTRLDADAALKTLLNVKGTSSKVILGPARPTVGSNPTIQLFVSGHSEDEEAKWGPLETTMAVLASDLPAGLADVQQIANIAERAVALLDDLPLTVTGHRIYNIVLTGLQPVSPAGNGPDGNPQHGQEVRFTCRASGKT